MTKDKRQVIDMPPGAGARMMIDIIEEEFTFEKLIFDN